MRYLKFYLCAAAISVCCFAAYSFIDNYRFGGGVDPEKKVFRLSDVHVVGSKLASKSLRHEDERAVYPVYSPDFSLVNQDGEKFTSRGLIGKYTLVMFGFSSCNTICPLQLANVAYALGKLGKLADRLNVVFITIDPERDTVDKLHEYHSRSDPRVIMLTGDKKELDKVAKGYKVFVGGRDGDGQIAHSSIMYLMDPNLHYLTHFTVSVHGSSKTSGSKSDADVMADGLVKYISARKVAGY